MRLFHDLLVYTHEKVSPMYTGGMHRNILPLSSVLVKTFNNLYVIHRERDNHIGIYSHNEKLAFKNKWIWAAVCSKIFKIWFILPPRSSLKRAKVQEKVKLANTYVTWTWHSITSTPLPWPSQSHAKPYLQGLGDRLCLVKSHGQGGFREGPGIGAMIEMKQNETWTLSRPCPGHLSLI